MAGKIRIDELVVAKGLAESRSAAKALVMSGKVRCGDRRLDKPGLKVDLDIEIFVEAGKRFVGRGGEKLLGFIERFGISFEECAVLDIGASTGGFTDCSLQNGAKSVTCLDVGKGQLHAKIRGDSRVVNIEGFNARHLKKGDLPLEAYDRIVVDLSFISLKTMLPVVWPFLPEKGLLVALVKPQFEVGKEIADKYRGVIKDPEARYQAYDEIKRFALDRLDDSTLFGEMESPIKGGDGNVEYLLGLTKGPSSL